MSKFCSQCGTPLPEGAMFCGNCGAPQKPVQPEPVPVVNSVEPVDVVAVAAPEPEVVESAPVFETQEVEVAAVVEPAAPIAEPVINEQPVVVPPVVEQPVPVQSPVAPAAPAKQQKKSKKWLFWAIPVAIVVILAIAAALLWKPLMLQFAPTAYLNMATTKTFSKLAERYEGSPSALFASTSEIMKKGTIDISVGTTGPENEQIKADISLGSDQENKQYAINGDLEMQGMTFDLDLYASNEVFALKLNPFTNGKYYGINYKSFDADIRTSALGDMLDEDTIAQISDIVDMVESAMDQSSDFEEILKPYLDKIAEFVRDTELTTDSAQIEVNDKNIKCDTITASFDKDGFVSLLEDLLDQLEKDEKLKETLTGGLSMVVVAGEDPYAEMIKTMRDALKDFEESIELEFDLTYYISKNALVAMGCELQMTADEEFGKFDAQMLISFGTDASKDDIETELKITAGESKGTVKIVSSVENKADSYCETMTVTVKSDEYKSTTKMVYDWNRNDGDLCIKVSTEEDGEKSEYSYDLILKETDKGFQIGCEDISDLIQSGENNDLSDDFIQTLDYVADENQSAPISVMITFTKGCQITKPEFINLDQIDDEALAEIMSNLGLGGEGEEDEEDPDDSWGDDIVGEQDVYTKDSYSEPDHIVIDNSHIVVGTVGKQWLTNGQLQIYYWNAVYDFLNEYGDYAEYIGLDYNKPLDEQVYEEDQGTWQHYFLQEAIDVWSYYSALAQKAEDQGILLGDAQQELDNLYEMLESQATLNGFNSVEEMIVADYGPGVTFNDYYDYMETFFYAQAYYDAAIADLAITEDMVESFYNENLSSYQDMGITKDSGNMYNIRHVLIEVAGSDNAAWETCKHTAETLMNKWILDGATEEDFIDMAIQYSNDPGSSANGGLYEYLNADTNFVPEFVNWYMDENRQIGDYGLIKTDYGYHLMYCSDIVAEWYAMAEMDLLDQVSADIIDDATDAYPICVDYRLIYLSVIDLSAE